MPRIFLQAIIQYGHRARWLRVLQCMLAVHGQPVVRNQTLILSLVLQERDRILNVTGDCPSTGAPRAQLIVEREYAKGFRSVLRYHATCIQLLADCCRGCNVTSQQKCRAVLSPMAVLDTVLSLHRAPDGPRPISSPAIRYVCQPFLSFLHHVYIDSKDFQPDRAMQPRLWSDDVCLLTAIACSLRELIVSGGTAREVESHSAYVFQYAFPLVTALLEKQPPTKAPENLLDFTAMVVVGCSMLGPQLTKPQVQAAQGLTAVLLRMTEHFGEAEDLQRLALDLLELRQQQKQSAKFSRAGPSPMALDFEEGVAMGRVLCGEGHCW